MKRSRHSFVLGLVFLTGVLALSCASGERSMVQPMLNESSSQHPKREQPTVEQPTYLAQSAVAGCLPRDSSMVCCIKKFPLTAKESCGAAAVEVAEVLNGVKVLNEATEQTAPETATGQETDEFAHNSHLPEWKQRCIRAYNQCQDDGWTGSCHDCLRRCEGQHEWPTTMCGPRKSPPG
jgi:hypothetical protein